MDNDPQKHGTKIFGKYDCYGKEHLLTLPADSSVVIVASSQYAGEIYQEVKDSYGTSENLPVIFWRMVVLLRWHSDRKMVYDFEYLRINHDWAECPVSRPQDAVFWAEKYHSVFLTDDDGKYVGTLPCRALMMSDVKNFQSIADLFSIDAIRNMKQIPNQYIVNESIPFSENEDEIFEAAKKIFMPSGILQEIPIVRDGHIISSVAWYNIPPFEEHYRVFDWTLVPDEVFWDFFGKHPRIHFQKESQFVLDFVKRFEKIADFIPKTEKGDSDGNDYFVYAYSIQNQDTGLAHIDVIRLYHTFLLNTLKNRLHSNGIGFYFIDYSGRVHRNRMIGGFELYLTGIEHVVLPGSGMRIERISDGFDDGVNVLSHHRVTPKNPENFNRTIYFFGPCVAFGNRVRDGETIESYIQQLLNDASMPVRVVNIATGSGSVNARFPGGILATILGTDFFQGDIVVLFSNKILYMNPEEIKNSKHYYSLADIFSLPENRELKCFQGLYAHCNAEGNRAIAKFLFDELRPMLMVPPTEPRTVLPSIFPEGEGPLAAMSEEMAQNLEAYLVTLRKERREGGTAGAIVMNANPFTKGHRYLVESARGRVTWLYVFVVEEDRSEFSFADRFEMVNRGCRDFPNVIVLPSGKYILSNATFAAYFQKAELQDQVVSPVFDVRIFGKKIAPCLGITTRFVGEEPFDKVTGQYNDAMKKTLPKYGVDVVEIPRYALKGDVVSATKVRRLLSVGDIEACQKYLPETTYRYVVERGTEAMRKL